MKSRTGWRVVIMGLGLMMANAVRANNLQVTNVTLSGRDDSTAYVQFDISWSNSWRYTNVNHDAAWVFFKVLPEGQAGWRHVTLEGTGTNPPGYVTGTGTGIEFLVPSDRMGLFVRRSTEGAGTLSVTNAKAVWNFASNGLVKTEKVRLQALAVEMVFVAEGSYWLGSGVTNSGELCEGGGGANPFLVTNAGPILCSNAVGCLWGGKQSGGDSMGGNGILSNAFPNGYSAFYCMKYEITEGQWVDFFNTLTDSQKIERDITGSHASYSGKNSDGVVDRNTVAWDHTNPAGDATSTRRDRVCNYVAWADGCAFTDWAGLRPMTELEYEKACRGPLVPAATNEYAWGTNTIMPDASRVLIGAENGNETVSNSLVLGGCNYGNPFAHTGGSDGGSGPLRAGIFATNGSTRISSGASYWGIMEMSGNLWERAVTIGNPASGRVFTGLHGNGVLTTANGDADVPGWPGNNGTGSGSRGSAFISGSLSALRVSDRVDANSARVLRYRHYGWRAVRSAPAGVGP